VIAVLRRFSYPRGMLPRSVGAALLFLLCFGCSPKATAPVNEERNPYFLEGKERVNSRDYKAAIAAFEKALEQNPRSALAHFELGVLYEGHSEQREEDYVAALYHYNQVVRLRPHIYPADNARQRMASCKQELVRSQSMAPVYQQTIRELDRLKEENAQLRRQVETLQAQAASRFVAPASLGGLSEGAGNPSHGVVIATKSGPTDTPIVIATNSSSTAVKERNSPPPSGRNTRSHTVRARETPYSIARSYGIKLDALLSANPGLDARRMKTGQTLNIPQP
jgi:tetratricopeptide (TPR) repeat protein